MRKSVVTQACGRKNWLCNRDVVCHHGGFEVGKTPLVEKVSKYVKLFVTSQSYAGTT